MYNQNYTILIGEVFVGLSLKIELPDWMERICAHDVFDGDREKMEFVLSITERNIHNGGGPFGAAIFDRKTNRLVSCGVNLVLQHNISVLHAEIVAFMFAQKRLGSYSLLKVGDFELFSSSEPCVMCMGACLWSGIKRLVFGASADEAKRIGFDEGPALAELRGYLESKGVEIKAGLLGDRARNLLEMYAQKGGVIYNA